MNKEHENLAFTNHPGIVDYKGKSYFFYHNQSLSNHGFRRSTCVEEFNFNADGTFPEIKPTGKGVSPITTLNPYKLTEAETIAWSEGVKTQQTEKAGKVYVTSIHNGDYIKVRNVDFKQGAKTVEITAASLREGKIEIYLDSLGGPLLGICEIRNTGGWLNWNTFSSEVASKGGIHDLFFVFKGGEGELFNLDSWLFTASNTANLTIKKKSHNPVVWADIPDISMIRVGETYYMSSTTMHMNPGVPIMKSKNLIDWEIVSYAYNTLGDMDEFELQNEKNAYGGGTWASSMRYHDGLFYVSTFSNNSNLNYLFYTDDPENTPWKMKSYKPKIHDHSLFFDDDKIYMLSCGGNVSIREVKEDFTGIIEETTRLLIENADIITGKERGLPAEGAQIFKVDGRYYIFLISWPKGGMRTVLLYRADHIMGPYEGKVVLENKGIAQGGFIDTPDGKWYGYFFRDRGAVGRIPYIVPMKWEDGWPVFGDNGIVPDLLDIEAQQPTIPACVASDEFSRKPNEPDLPLVWQWNHNPDNTYWSVNERPGYLRLTTFRLDKNFTEAKNTLTQRTFGPMCSGEVSMDVSKMKDGDFAGLGLLQEKYGIVGVKVKNGQKYIFAGNTQNSDVTYEELETVPFNSNEVYFKVQANFKDQADKANFYYSLNGKEWINIGNSLQMVYTLSHFMGYRFALFNYATEQAGGSVDFNYFRVE
ncbi:glycoside hydrolase [Bacteroides sp. 519]|nr:glycoside hydrolase [Bacteroides sp. 519]